ALVERLAATVAVRLSTPVRWIRQRPTGVEVAADGLVVRARRAVMAMPLVVADRIGYDPPLPVERAQLHQRATAGTTIKVHFVYPRPFWRERGSNGRIFTGGGFVRVTFDDTPQSGRPGILVGFVEADQAREFRRRAPDARREAALACLVPHFGPDAAEPV